MRYTPPQYFHRQLPCALERPSTPRTPRSGTVPSCVLHMEHLLLEREAIMLPTTYLPQRANCGVRYEFDALTGKPCIVSDMPPICDPEVPRYSSPDVKETYLSRTPLQVFGLAGVPCCSNLRMYCCAISRHQQMEIGAVKRKKPLLQFNPAASQKLHTTCTSRNWSHSQTFSRLNRRFLAQINISA